MAAEDGDNPSRGSGWDTKDFISGAFDILSNTGGISGGSNKAILSENAIKSAYPILMSANPVELGHYNMMNDLAANEPFVKNFDSTILSPDIPAGKAVIWAPVYPPGAAATTTTGDIISKVNDLFGDPSNTNLGQGTNSSSAIGALKSVLTQALTTYVTSTLESGSGENNEGINTMVITNVFPSSGAPGGGGSAKYFTGLNPDPLKINTSWNNTVDDNSYANIGRTGYSVKMVTMGSLKGSGKNTTDGSNLWSNDFTFDDEASADIAYIQH